MREVVLGTVPDFIDIHIHLPTFLWQLQCFVERIIKKRLSDSFIHNSAMVKCQQQLCFSPQPMTMPNVPASVLFVIVMSFPGQLILKLAGDVQDWTGLWTSEVRSIIWFPDLLFKFIGGF